MADEETETESTDEATESTDDTESKGAETEDKSTDEKPKTDTELARARREAAKYRTDLRKAEKELADAKAASLSDTERAIVEAKASGATEATTAMTLKLVGAELRAAQVPAAVVEDLNLARFVGEDGEIDADAIAAAGTKYAPAVSGAVDLKQGVRGNNGPSLEQQIAEAKKAGDSRKVISLEMSRLNAG